MAAIIEVEHLKKYFDTPRGKLHAVDDVSFKIEQGTTMGVVGESGCGKSTLGRTIIHLQESTGGKIFFQGEDVTQVSGKKLHQLREDMQIIFQDPFSSLNPRMTIQETIREPLLLSGRFKKSEIEAETRRLMDQAGIAQRLAMAYPHELDGGRRQRVGIARALALNPKFVVCDEPVSALDVSIQAQILQLEKLQLVCHCLKLRGLAGVEAFQPLGEVVQFLHIDREHLRALENSVEAVDLLNLAVRLDRVADLQRLQQLHAVRVLVVGDGERDGRHAVFRVAWITQNCAHHDHCPPFSR